MAMSNSALGSHFKKYSERYIAFLDVLGFRSLIEQTVAGDQSTQRTIISGIVRALRRARKDLKEHGCFDVSFTQFSDSFVISIPKASDNLASFAGFVLALFSVTETFIEEGMLIRGGITCGSLVHTRKYLFGPAMNRAYYLESKIARVPRIVIDPQLVIPRKVSSPGVIAVDDDDLRYINYFEPRKVFYIVPSVLCTLRAAIEAIPQSDDVREKRAWCVKKYNAVVAQFSYADFERKLMEYVEDGDSNPVTWTSYPRLLEDARRLQRL